MLKPRNGGAMSIAPSRLQQLLATTAVATLAATTMPMAHAAEDGRPGIIEEIVVTARNIEESLQDTPVAVSAIGGDTLDIFRIDEATDLVSRIPALNVSVGGSEPAPK